MMLVRRPVAALAEPRLTGLSAGWQPVGPGQVATLAYGNVAGRVSSIAIDPADLTGNTVYLGTTGGGVWKSTNAAGPVSSVTFTPLTDTLPVFSANSGTAAIPSLSIGAVSVNSGVVLAGTGDPNDASDSYYGSGLLRSADGGLTWTLIQNSHDGVAGNHSFTGLSFAGFAWSGSSPGLVVAAVSEAAEGTLVDAVDVTNSVKGLYYSTDSGVTWQMAVIMDGSQVVQTPLPSGANLGGNAATAVVWNPVRQRFYAAVRYHGYYQSADGVTWTRLTHQPGAGLTATACPTNPGLRGSLTCPIFRGALAVQASSGDTFALTVDSNNVDQGLWQDVCAVSGGGCGNAFTFGTQLASAPLEVGSGSTVIEEADYNLSLATSPAGTDTWLYVGTVDLYRCSLGGGCVLRNTTNSQNGCSAPAQVAPSQHAVVVLGSLAQPLLYTGNDGGVWRSTDGVNEQGTACSAGDATHFQNLNGGLGSLAEVVSFAQHPTDARTLLVGLGANGTAATSAGDTATNWPQIAAGEGGTVAIDPDNSSLWYVSTAAGVSIRQCLTGTSCTAADFAGAPTIGSAQIGGDDSLVDAPWLLDPALSSEVVIGTCRAWRGPAGSGTLWSSANAISRMFGGPQNAACSSANPIVRSLAAGGAASGATSAQDAGSRVLYAGIAGTLDGGSSLGGHLFATTAAGTGSGNTAWSDVAVSPVADDVADAGHFNPGGFDISSVVADSHDATGETVYATVMGFAGNGTNAPHVYRSVDAGAHWTNISGNLPNAPANSLVIDPNDANTVYVALDTGVYVTTQVSSCTTTNCWSIYGAALPNAPVIQLAAAGGMPTGDGRTGELRAATYGRGIWQIPLLTAVTAAQPAMSLSATALSFAAQTVGTASAAQTETVTNTGNAALTVSQVAVTGDFTEADTCTAAPIAVGSSCAVQVRFLPAATGARSGGLTVYGNVAGGQATVTLSGIGTPAGAVVLNPVVASFPATVIGATSAVQNITVSNTGASVVALQTPIVTGDFRITANTCGSTLGPSVGCTVSVVFAPVAAGNRSGSLSVTDDAGTQTTSLSGVGTSPATDALSPLLLSFAAQQLGTSSPVQQVMLTNSGDVALTLIAAQITAGDFSVVNSCGNSLNAHSSCAIGVAYQPKSVGPGSGALAVSDQFRTQTVALNGVGVAPPGVSLSPVGPLVFAATPVGMGSAAQTVTLTNNGGLPLVLQSVAATGDFAIVAGSNGCGTTVAVATACTMQVVFTPTVGGPRSGALTVTDNAGNSPQTLTLSGTGVDFSLSANGGTTVSTSSGGNAVFPLLLSSAANVPGTVTFTCSGAPANSTCVVTPGAAALGAAITISATVDTGVTSSSVVPAQVVRRPPLFWLAMVFPLGLVGYRFRLRFGGACLLVLLLMIQGCGAGRSIPSASGTGGSPSGSGAVTPSGTYSIVVAASSAGLTRTVNLTLVVK